MPERLYFARAGFFTALGAPLLTLLSSAPRALCAVPDAERWATITHPGNAPYVFYEDGQPILSLGAVDYDYRIARTETTGSEWFEFVQAYAPYVDPEFAINSGFTSQWVNISYGEQGQVEYRLHPGGVNRPVEVSWRFAARYVNWLHNGKALTPEAFESGAYDTSTFGQNPDGSITDQPAHSPGALYWIPTLDEWTKAAYFDPDRHGPAQPGYWWYPNWSDVPSIPGLPNEGGETSAGFVFASLPYPEVGAYSNVQSPWGLWDLSGGVSEWLEDLYPPRYRGVRGSVPNSPHTYWITDRLGGAGEGHVSSRSGVRLARVIPEPSTLWLTIMIALTGRKRRK